MERSFDFEFSETEVKLLREALLAYSEDFDTKKNHPFYDLYEKLDVLEK